MPARPKSLVKHDVSITWQDHVTDGPNPLRDTHTSDMIASVRPLPFLLAKLPFHTPVSSQSKGTFRERAPGNGCTCGSHRECKHCISRSMAGAAQARWPSSACAPFAAPLRLCSRPFACCCAECSLPAVEGSADDGRSGAGVAGAPEWVREGVPELGDWGDKRMMARSTRCR